MAFHTVKRYSSHLYQVLTESTFITQVELSPLSSYRLFPSPSSLGDHCTSSVFMDLPFLDVLYKWESLVWLLCLTCTWHKVFEVHSFKTCDCPAL